jgi:Uma2 family endonuclease
MALYRLLFAGCPDEFEVVVSPYDWYLAEDTVFVPDLMVVARVVGDRARQEQVPVLVVEVLSPSTATSDRTLKRHEYAQAGAPNFLIVDPVEPSVTALRLEGGAYVEVAAGAGDAEVNLTEPWPLSLRPSALSPP